MIEQTTCSSRRAFLKNGSIVLAGAAFGDLAGCAALRTDTRTRSRQRIALISDVHYAERDPVGTRHYRLSLEKMKTAAAALGWTSPHLGVQLGDFIDSGQGAEDEMEHARRISAAFSTLGCQVHHVLGNHDLGALSKPEFMSIVGKARSWYSIDRPGAHLVILDACFRADGVAYERGNFHWQDTAIPPDELDWLAADLEAADRPVIVFTHQRLDDTASHSVVNASEVRQVLERSGKVLAVIQGHSHRNAYVETNGIHYVVLRAMVDEPALGNNAYALLHVYDDGLLRIDGFGHQASHTLRRLPQPS
ncbi:MAG: metallophosphoesterase family protein [Planctomycetota bacterium]|jgi:alkaline phosphatase